MAQALYRKYRSKSLDEIVGQDHIIAALKNAVASGQISHAYLFTGPRGIGKTSIARILAHEVNGLPYTDDNAHIDIIEIDAASNRGIDEIRDLREKVYISPTSGKYKVYIIDEVHMLTPAAFNALLKTLEEPPAHVIFILATTEAHKLPATIISRTQRYSFRPATEAQTITLLRRIADAEHIQIGDDALKQIAEHGDGSFRDSVSLLDQIAGNADKITATDVQHLLGRPSAESIKQLANDISRGDITGTVQTLEQLQEDGFQTTMIAKQISAVLRESLLAGKPLLTPAKMLPLLKSLINVATSPNPARYLELTLLEYVAPPDMPVETPKPPQKSSPAAPTSTLSAKKPAPEESKADNKPVTPKKPTAKAALAASGSQSDVTPVQPAKPASQPDVVAALDASNWPQVLTELKSEYNTLYSIIRMANTSFSDGKVELTFNFAFHQKRVNEAKNRKILARVVKQVCGQEVEIVCNYDKNSKPSAVVAAAIETSSPVIETVSNIFGGGELIES